MGGKTRLAQALYAASSRAGHRTFVAYGGTPAERASLLALYPESALVDGTERAGTVQPKCIVVCALGLAHPAQPDIDRHMERLAWDSRLLSTLVSNSRDRIHVILVSTVIALVPPRDRAYYAAFKNLAEAVVAASLRDSVGSRMSVLYPGRLVERCGFSRIADLFATPYGSLARRLVAIASADKPVARVVGLDARLWVLAKAVRTLVGAVSPNCGVTPVQARDGLPRI
ncbi:MAG: hypothetical protein Q7T97_16185 [Burkholderiaceae bacterium]|nr:hypothetical protein [Burkholderiaceae bacterium]